MKMVRTTLVCLGLLICLATLVPLQMAKAAPVPALVVQLSQPAAVQPGPTEPVDVVVVLDDSGSMATCWPWPRGEPPFFPPCRAPSSNPPSDPDDLRYSAARLLLELVDDDDRVAVVRFDTVAGGVGSLGTLQRVGDASNRSQLAASLQPPDDYFSRGYTRLDLGLETAAELLRSGREPGRSQYILLLTDGEPSQPDSAGDQRPRVRATADALRDEGVLTFPVVLCNPTAGCAGDFLREEFAADGVAEAGTAQDLLRVFSEILSAVKPDRSVITSRNGAGQLQVQTRPAHGARKLAFVTPGGALGSLRRDGEPVLARAALSDPNIDVNVLGGDALLDGQWTAETADASGFAVVQADSYPQLLNPPPSLANSPASVRYYPAGKPPLLIARGSGPGAGEALLLNGETAMPAFGQDNARALLPTEELTTVKLQLGDDTEPLQMVRQFRLEARPDLPRAEVFAPLPDNAKLLADGHAQLQVGFAGGAGVQNMAATVYVFDDSQAAPGDASPGDGAPAQPVYQAAMTCAERLCTDEQFEPADGRSYTVYYVIQGDLDGVRFSDWAEAGLALAPAVYLRGLPTALDLAQMPPDGWPVELAAGTLDDIGSLAATLVLRRADTGEEVTSATLDFDVEVPESGSVSTALRVDGLDSLRPGAYTGEVRLEASTPSGLPMDVGIRPAPSLPVTLDVPRPAAYIDTTLVDFGETLFDTSPNFRLDQSVQLPVRFDGKPFPVTVRLEDATCTGVNVAGSEVTATDGAPSLPLRLTSAGPIQPGACQGTLHLAGPSADYDVFPAQVEWQSRVADVEWSIVNGALALGDLQDAGARAGETLLVRYNGKTPFMLEVQDIQASGTVGESGVQELTGEQLEAPPIEVAGLPNEAGLYAVPLALVARQAIPTDPLRGAFYSGELQLGVVGLPGKTQTLGIAFRSPSLYQRYVAPIVVPVYSLPWLLCTGPLTLLLALVVVARVRGRGIGDPEVDEAAIAATMQLTTPAAAGATGQELFTPVASAQLESVWGNAEWGSPWRMPDLAPEGTASAYRTNGARTDDPWSSGWS